MDLFFHLLPLALLPWIVAVYFLGMTRGGKPIARHAKIGCLVISVDGTTLVADVSRVILFQSRDEERVLRMLARHARQAAG